jgi:hypothetical protein
MSDTALQFVLSEKPSAVIIGGPPSYLSGVKVAENSIRKGMENLVVIARKVPLVVADHHLLRSEDSVRELSAMSASTKRLGGTIMNAAEYIGKEPQFLEARRKTLYKEDPPSKQFIKWAKLRDEQQRQTKPPLK